MRGDRWPRYSWLSRWSTMENDNGSAARCNSDSKNSVSCASRDSCTAATHARTSRNVAWSRQDSGRAASFVGSDRGSRHAPHDVVRQVPQHRLGVGIRQAIEGVGGLLGVPLGALPGIFE